ncbi:universal stress protein [Natronolimnohabitans innermongolicus]|uniref:UspA domain-containing protein n=1 Tax=Natronolimnohabitans innermongolicus JCM 12255 TaxID=1227499 RepID=L9WZE9_9EURY|nr:universal stress protein [Natronolimnohabitans innermongolicus]ELY54850.1 UspA domain-containing protein [Natronolimnohabitans innermongolicus JCM 12255]
MATLEPDRILVPTLGRPREDEALTYTLETFPDADVILLAVVTPLDAPMSEGGVLERHDERTEAARASAVRMLEGVDEPPTEERVRIDTAEGRPGNVVPQYVTDNDVDHVVLYGHDSRSSGLVGRLLGQSVAATVVDRTPRPVTILE